MLPTSNPTALSAGLLHGRERAYAALGITYLVGRRAPVSNP